MVLSWSARDGRAGIGLLVSKFLLIMLAHCVCRGFEQRVATADLEAGFDEAQCCWGFGKMWFGWVEQGTWRLWKRCEIGAVKTG